MKNVALDLCDPFKKFAREHFPNADLIADKFHVLRLLNPSINRRRKTLRKTLMKWRFEILNYFKNRITNARTEGFNNVAKLYQKRAFGYKNFENYRLRLLNA